MHPAVPCFAEMNRKIEYFYSSIRNFIKLKTELIILLLNPRWSSRDFLQESSQNLASVVWQINQRILILSLNFSQFAVGVSVVSQTTCIHIRTARFVKKNRSLDWIINIVKFNELLTLIPEGTDIIQLT